MIAPASAKAVGVEFVFAMFEGLAMIHYSCDLCKRPLEPKDDLRYVVKIEVYAAFDPLRIEDEDRDQLQDLDEILERIDDVSSAELGDEVFQEIRFDLCPDCRAKFLKNPLGRKSLEAFGFSKN